MGTRRSIATLYKPAILALLALLWVQSPPALHAQGAAGSIRQAELERYRGMGPKSEKEWDSLQGRHSGGHSDAGTMALSPQAACRLNKVVFGWNPYWMGTAYREYDYSLLSDICYFSYEVDPATGGYQNIYNWKTTDLPSIAKAAGTRVHLCVTLFSGHALLLENPESRRTLVDSLLALVSLRDGDGVNIDFEGVPAGQRGNLTSFMIELATRFHTARPGSMISMAVPAVDWSNAFDIAAMTPHVDLFIIMGYDYHWAGGERAGPVAPKNSGPFWGPYDVTRSINYYLGQGAPPAKLALGVPYYGYDWPTVDSAAGSATTGGASAVLYASARERAGTYGRRWDIHSSTPYYVYQTDSTWRQTWYDDEQSLGLKYDLVLMKNLAGIGIWALGYDGIRRETWDAIESHFTDCAASPCTGTFTDMGGPTGNYYNNEEYVFTIAPEHASKVTLSFFSFNVADDRLLIYDGRGTTAPLVGVFTGMENPGTIIATGGAITLKFISGGSTVSWGWVANWSCLQQPQSVEDIFGNIPGSIGLGVHPNPYRGETVIEYNLVRPSPVEITITDISGRVIYQKKIVRQTEGRHYMNFSAAALGLPPGAYLVRVNAGSATVSNVLLEQR